MAGNKNTNTTVEKTEIAVIEITEELLREKLYEIRGKKVMLDADLAEIYGYETKAFNQQVKRNIERFPEDMMFQLIDSELENLRSQFVTANISSMTRSNPFVFTEQGVYMLMTVLKGDLAVKQSHALVRTFKKMKDYILANQGLIGQREIMQLSMQTADNTVGIHKLRMEIGSVEKQMSDIMEQLGDVVTKSELAEMMNGFVNDEDNGWLMFNTKYCSADVAYSSIYSQAKKSVYLVDNYIGLRTLALLKNAPAGTDIKIFSDNIGSGKLHNVEYTDFCKEYPNINLSMQHTGGIFHDRFIVLDYGIDKYKPMIKKLLQNGLLQLP